MNFSFYLHFVEKDAKRLLWNLVKLKDNLDREAYTELPRELAIRYKVLLVERIKSQKGVSAWGVRGWQYHPVYAQWKMDYAKQSGFWRLTDDLLNALQVFPLGAIQRPGTRSGAYVGGRKGRAYMAGIPGSLMDTGGKSWYWPLGHPRGKPKKIAKYAWILEYGGDYRDRGGGKHPKRPMFGPALEEFRWGEGWDYSWEVLRKIGARSWRG